MMEQKLLNRRDAIILLSLAAVGILLWLLFQTGSTEHMTAEITVDNTCIAQYDLSSAPKGTFALPQAEGVVFEISDQGIRITENDCLGRQCVHTGWISRPNQTIVCLPKKLMIQLTGSEDAPPDVVI